MTDEEKNRFDALAELRRPVIERFTTRQKTEWRLTLTIWGGLAALGGLFLTEARASMEQFASELWIFVLFVILLGAVLGLQCYFLIAVGALHDRDRNYLNIITASMASIAGSESPPSSTDQGKVLGWSRSVQLAISVILSVALVLMAVGHFVADTSSPSTPAVLGSGETTNLTRGANWKLSLYNFLYGSMTPS